MTTPLPDHVGAFIAYWRANGDVTTICPADRIRGKIPSGMDSGYFILVAKAGGGNEEPYVPYYRPRLDVKFYGPTEYEATRLFRTAHPTVVPQDRRRLGFVAADCYVAETKLVGGPFDLVDPDLHWAHVLVTYEALVLQYPVSAL